MKVTRCTMTTPGLSNQPLKKGDILDDINRIDLKVEDGTREVNITLWPGGYQINIYDKAAKAGD
jgi:hypothetical protein